MKSFSARSIDSLDEWTEVSLLFFDAESFRIRVKKWWHYPLWTALRIVLGRQPWHVVAVVGQTVYECDFAVGCRRFGLSDLDMIPARKLIVTIDGPPQLRDWAEGRRLQFGQTVLAVLGFRATPINCCSCVSRLIGLLPEAFTTWDLIDRLERI